MKTLSDRTFGEVKELCQSMDHCYNCELRSGDTDCLVAEMVRRCKRPMEWKFQESRQLTEPELAICRLIGVNWVTREPNPDYSAGVYLWDKNPVGKNGSYIDDVSLDNIFIAIVNCSLFPSVFPGDCIEVPNG